MAGALLTAVAMVGLAPSGVAPMLNETAIDIQWMVHEHGSCRQQHLQLTWQIVDSGTYRVRVDGYNDNGNSDPFAYDTGQFTVAVYEGFGPQNIYDSGCSPLTGDDSHGRGYAYATIERCTTGCNVVASDEAECHWGHDLYCGEHSGT